MIDIGSQVWVVLCSDNDDHRLEITLPEKPQKGIVMSHNQIWVDNDLIFTDWTNVFESEDRAWCTWKSILTSKKNKIEQMIDNFNKV